MNYYDQIKNKLIDNEVFERVKDYSKERNRVITYFEVGKLLSEAGKHYGENIIGEYSEKLMKEVGKKYNERTLRRMRQLYYLFKEEKWSPFATKLLTWSNYTEIISIRDSNKRYYYIDRCIKEHLSRNDLRKIIKEKEYERLDEETKIKLIENKEIELLDEVKSPIIIHSKNIDVTNIKEKVLKELILDDLDNFLRQLGSGYTYVGNEYKIKIGSNYNYIDILLFNYIYNCFVVVELKVTELKKEHIGQVKFYMNYVDENLKELIMNKTIGLIVVKENNKYVIKYSSDKRIKAIEYSII